MSKEGRVRLQSAKGYVESENLTRHISASRNVPFGSMKYYSDFGRAFMLADDLPLYCHCSIGALGGCNRIPYHHKSQNKSRRSTNRVHDGFYYGTVQPKHFFSVSYAR